VHIQKSFAQTILSRKFLLRVKKNAKSGCEKNGLVYVVVVVIVVGAIVSVVVGAIVSVVVGVVKSQL